MTSQRVNVKRSMLLSAMSFLFVPLVGLVTAPILAQSLGVDGRGSVAAAMAPLMLFVAMFGIGLPQSMVHFVAKDPGILRLVFRKVFVLQILIGILSSFVVYLISPLLSPDDPSLSDLIILAGLVLPGLLVVEIVRGTASGLNSWGLVTFERCTCEFFRLASLLGLLVAGKLTVFSAVLVLSVMPVLSSFSYMKLLKQELRVRRAPSNIQLRSIVHYGVRIWVGSLTGLLLTRLSQVLMTPLAGVAQLGYFVAAVNVADVSLLVNNAVRDVTLASDSADSLDSRATKSARSSFFLSLLVGIAIISTLPLWFTRLFGDSFQPSEILVVVLVIANVLGVPGSVAGAILSARGYPGRRSVSLLIACLFNILLLVLLLPVLGAFGAALAALVGNLLASNMNIIFARRLLGLKFSEFYLIRFSDITSLFSYGVSIIRSVRKMVKKTDS